MNSEHTSYQLMDDYLQDRLSDTEKQAFELRLLKDESLKYEVSLRKFSNRLIINNRLLDIKHLSAETRRNIKIKRTFLKVSGVMLIAGTIGAFFWHFNTPTSKKVNRKAPSYELSPKTTVPAASESAVLKKKVILASKLKPKEPVLKKNKMLIAEQVAEDPVFAIKETMFNEPLIPEPVQPDEKLVIPVPEKKKLVSEAKKPCTNVFLDAKISSNGTCVNYQNGIIQVSEIKGGAEPYHWIIVSEKNKDHVNQNQLATGSYSVLITDRNNCEKKIEHVTVKELACLEEYRFNPFLGEAWELAPAPGAGMLMIHERGGNKYYQARIEAGDAFTWDGTSLKGEIKQGLYIFTIDYEDETRKQGEIVILR